MINTVENNKTHCILTNNVRIKAFPSTWYNKYISKNGNKFSKYTLNKQSKKISKHSNAEITSEML